MYGASVGESEGEEEGATVEGVDRGIEVGLEGPCGRVAGTVDVDFSGTLGCVAMSHGSTLAGFNRSMQTESRVPFTSSTKYFSVRDTTLKGPSYGAWSGLLTRSTRTKTNGQTRSLGSICSLRAVIRVGVARTCFINDRKRRT